MKFRRWDDILKSQPPDEKAMPITTAMWHFARGMAMASKGDLGGRRSEREKLVAIRKSFPEGTMMGMLNKADHVLGIAQNTLDAKIAAKQKKFSDAERELARGDRSWRTSSRTWSRRTGSAPRRVAGRTCC